MELANLWSEELPLSMQPEKSKEIIKETLGKIISANNIKGRVIASVGGWAVNIQTVKIP